MTSVSILLYHSISEAASDGIESFTTTPAEFGAHLDAVVASGLPVLTVSEFAARREPAVVITFDDGFADFAEHALPALAERGLPSTLYVTTGFLDTPGMLRASQLREFVGHGVEIGAHTHTHPQLDTISLGAARDEITQSKQLLEDALGSAVKSFAYPHGYSSAKVRGLVRDAGFSSACAVRNTLSSTTDDRFALARLTVRDTTTAGDVAGWLEGRRVRSPRRRERVATKAWRAYRRTKALTAER